MNVNKKFDRFKQWAGEKMGGEAKTNATDDFRALEMEMNLRHEGMEKLHKSMSIYVKALSKKSDAEGGDKLLPVGYMGSTMVGHGQDFAPDSEFGNCLIHFGRANESLARKQEAYCANATSIWLESLERSLAQMKEYQAARKKLEARRLAYDASLGKMQKAKKEDFRVEEDLRAQKAKYEESSEDVYRRMEDIKESEVESVADLTNFLESELEYHQSCLEVLVELKRKWPAQTAYGEARRMGRARAGTAHSFTEKLTAATSRENNPYDHEDDDFPPPKPPRISTNTSTSNASIPKLTRADSIRREYDSPTSLSRTSSRQEYPSRPSSVTPSGITSIGRGAGSGTASREYSPERRGHNNGTNDNTPIFARTPLRPVMIAQKSQDDYAARRPSPTQMSSYDAYSGSASAASGQMPVLAAGGIKKAPPPPPPARGKKPAPPPPMKRASYQA